MRNLLWAWEQGLSLGEVLGLERALDGVVDIRGQVPCPGPRGEDQTSAVSPAPDTETTPLITEAYVL